MPIKAGSAGPRRGAGVRQRREEAPGFRNGLAALGLDDEVVAPEALQPFEWRRGGAEDADLPRDFGRRERRERRSRGAVRFRKLEVGEEREEEVRVGRVAE